MGDRCDMRFTVRKDDLERLWPERDSRMELADKIGPNVVYLYFDEINYGDFEGTGYPSGLPFIATRSAGEGYGHATAVCDGKSLHIQDTDSDGDFCFRVDDDGSPIVTPEWHEFWELRRRVKAYIYDGVPL